MNDTNGRVEGETDFHEVQGLPLEDDKTTERRGAHE